MLALKRRGFREIESPHLPVCDFPPLRISMPTTTKLQLPIDFGLYSVSISFFSGLDSDSIHIIVIAHFQIGNLFVFLLLTGWTQNRVSN